MIQCTEDCCIAGRGLELQKSHKVRRNLHPMLPAHQEDPILNSEGNLWSLGNALPPNTTVILVPVFRIYDAEHLGVRRW